MSGHYEIERKYLVEYPEFPLPCEDRISDIRQAYLISEPGVSERVRARDGRYYHTKKRRVSGICAEEREREISREEYEQLLARRDGACRLIEKKRHVFEYMGQVFELDVFPFWKRQAMLEIELEGESIPVFLPPFLKIIREVTDDEAYKNHAMSMKIPGED
jgi:CYTH domain-containing protein